MYFTPNYLWHLVAKYLTYGTIQPATSKELENSQTYLVPTIIITILVCTHKCTMNFHLIVIVIRPWSDNIFYWKSLEPIFEGLIVIAVTMSFIFLCPLFFSERSQYIFRYRIRNKYLLTRKYIISKDEVLSVSFSWGTTMMYLDNYQKHIFDHQEKLHNISVSSYY